MIKGYNYKELLCQNGKQPVSIEELSKQENLSQSTVSVLALYEDSKQLLFKFHYWLLPSHNQPEVRLSSFSFYQLT